MHGNMVLNLNSILYKVGTNLMPFGCPESTVRYGGVPMKRSDMGAILQALPRPTHCTDCHKMIPPTKLAEHQAWHTSFTFYRVCATFSWLNKQDMDEVSETLVEDFEANECMHPINNVFDKSFLFL